MAHVVEVKQVPPQPLAVVRRRARPDELSTVVPQACGEVWTFLKSAGISGAGRHVAVYLDGAINLEVGAEVSQPIQGDGQVVGSATPAGTVATTVHMGPYHRLSEAHAAIHDWCAANQREMAGPSWEVYGHWENDWNEDPSQIRTDVYYLLKEEESAG